MHAEDLTLIGGVQNVGKTVAVLHVAIILNRRALSVAAERPRPVQWTGRRWRSAVRVTSCVQVFRVYCVMRQVFLQMLWPAGC